MKKHAEFENSFPSSLFPLPLIIKQTKTKKGLKDDSNSNHRLNQIRQSGS
jgi:hypothetical protein